MAVRHSKKVDRTQGIVTVLGGSKIDFPIDVADAPVNELSSEEGLESAGRIIDKRYPITSDEVVFESSVHESKEVQQILIKAGIKADPLKTKIKTQSLDSPVRVQRKKFAKAQSQRPLSPKNDTVVSKVQTTDHDLVLSLYRDSR